MNDKESSMIVIKVSAGSPEQADLLLRQTPGGLGIWKNCKFLVNQTVEHCDWWVVCRPEGLVQPESTHCDPNHVVYISTEPTEDVGKITTDYLNQFSHLILCDRKIQHTNIKYATGLTWWVGLNVRHEKEIHNFSLKYELDYDSLKAMECPEKIGRISVVLSKKSFLEGHKKRLDFLTKLMEQPIGEYIDVFGGGFNPILDKWDVIAPYKYHLVLENDVTPDYWTEKLADAFLGFTYPIYYGCPNINDYFSPESLYVIDIDDVEGTSNKLLELIKLDAYANHVVSIEESRNKVLDDYNIFEMMSDICKGQAQSEVKCSLTSNNFFFESWLKRTVRNLVYRNKYLLAVYRKARKILSKDFLKK